MKYILKIFKNQIAFNLKQLCLVYKTWVRALLNLKILILLAKYHTFLLIWVMRIWSYFKTILPSLIHVSRLNYLISWLFLELRGLISFRNSFCSLPNEPHVAMSCFVYTFLLVQWYLGRWESVRAEHPRESVSVSCGNDDKGVAL